MIRIYSLLLVLLIALLPSEIMAQQSTSKDEAIRQIIHQLNIEHRLDETPDELRSQFMSNPFQLPPDQSERMIDLFTDAFQADSLLAETRQIFGNKYNQTHGAAVKKWLDSDTTKIVHRAENEFFTIQGTRKRIVRMYEMEQEPPSEERKVLINDFIEATSAAESTLDSYAIIFRSFISAFSALSNQQTFSESQIDGFVSNYRANMQTQIGRDLTDRFLIMYHDLDNRTLQSYISFYETDSGQWLSNTTRESIHGAYKSAADRFVTSINSSD